MAAYTTIDYLPDLSATDMNSARPLVFTTYVPVIKSDLIGWDNEAYFGTSENYAILNDQFVFSGTEGATYDIFSNSFFDPFILLLYDDKGNVIAHDKDQGSYGSDMIFGFVAPYTGKYYINASWDQGIADGHKYVSVSVYEDIDTIPKISPPITPTIPVVPTLPSTPIAVPTNNADRIFNWAEQSYSDLFPNHPESQNIFGYHARIYSNGDALGEKDESIYYYDGGANGTGETVLVGVVADFLPQAETAGF